MEYQNGQPLLGHAPAGAHGPNPKRISRPQGTVPLVKALARAFRWKRMLESGEFNTINELAEREGIAPSYMTRVLRLTLLAPDIVKAILDGQQGMEVTLGRLLDGFPVEWKLQFGYFRMVSERPWATSVIIETENRSSAAEAIHGP